MFSPKDKLEFKQFFGKFIIILEFLIILYIVFCAWYLGQAVKEENESQYESVRRTITFFFLPINITYLYFSIRTDPGEMKNPKNKIFSYLNHLENILVLIKDNIDNKEIELLVEPEENHHLEIFMNIQAFLEKQTKDTLENQCLLLFEIIEKLSKICKIEIEECSKCLVKKLIKVHHCSTCEK